MHTNQCASNSFRVLALIQLIYSCQSFDLPAEDRPQSFCVTEKPGCPTKMFTFPRFLSTPQSVTKLDYEHFDFCPMYGELSAEQPVNIEFMKNVEFERICTRTYTGGDSVSEQRLATLKRGIDMNYAIVRVIDRMPILFCTPKAVSFGPIMTLQCQVSFPFGCHNRDGDRKDGFCPYAYELGFYYMYNHLNFTITFTGERADPTSGRLVSIDVLPMSCQHNNQTVADCGPSTAPLAIPNDLKPNETFAITYTYSVHFERDDASIGLARRQLLLIKLPYANRTLGTYDDGFVGKLLLGCLLAAIYVAWEVRRDIRRFNERAGAGSRRRTADGDRFTAMCSGHRRMVGSWQRSWAPVCKCSAWHWSY